MSRNKAKGTEFETQVVDYLREVLGDDRIERRATCGKNDRGDVSGLTLRRRRVVVECKNHREMRLAKWLDEVEEERGNDDAEFAFVVHKRYGKGAKNMGDTYVTCDLKTLAAVIAGGREYMYPDGKTKLQVKQDLMGIDEDG